MLLGIHSDIEMDVAAGAGQAEAANEPRGFFCRLSRSAFAE